MGLSSRPPGIAESDAVVNASKAERVRGRVRECPPHTPFLTDLPGGEGFPEIVSPKTRPSSVRLSRSP